MNLFVTLLNEFTSIWNDLDFNCAVAVHMDSVLTGKCISRQKSISIEVF